jgi:site-specific DNA recombinase
MIKAVVYTRFSPRRNADKSESCETQLSYCEKYAEAHDMTIMGVFADKGISGKDERRPNLWAAISALDKGYVLLTYKLDRLARNVYLSECIRRAVEKEGARIEAVQGDVSGDGPEQIMIRQVLSVFNEYERKIIAARTKYALLYHQANGKRVSRYPPYGWKIDPEDDKRLIESPEEQPVLKAIIALHTDQELTAGEIVTYMKKEMPEKARGNFGWTKRAVSRILAKI